MNQNYLVLLGKLAFATATLAICSTAIPTVVSPGNASTQRKDAERLAQQPTRRESRQNNNLIPAPVANAVLQNLSQQTGIRVNQLRILEAQQQTWPNGCLGISSPGITCAQSLIPGWRVVVGNDKQRWIYRTNLSGSLVKLDPMGSQNTAVNQNAAVNQNVAASAPSPPSRLPLPPSRRVSGTASRTQAPANAELPPVDISENLPINPEANTETEPGTIDTEPGILRTQPTVRQPEPTVRQPEPTIRQPEPTIRQPEPIVRQPEPTIRQPEPPTAIIPRREVPPPRQINPSREQGNFSLSIRQPAANLSEVIARVSLKAKNDNSYREEQFIGDYRYRLNQRARFVGGMNAGDRIVVRLYDPQNNTLIGYSEFDLLPENAAVNLIFSNRPTLHRMVRTLYGPDSNGDGNIDPNNDVYDYYTQVVGIQPNQEQVVFLTTIKSDAVSWFQVAGLAVPPAMSVYPASFGIGGTNEVVAVRAFHSNLPSVLIATPGKESRITTITSNNSSYEVSQLLAASRATIAQPTRPTAIAQPTRQTAIAQPTRQPTESVASETTVSFADVPSNHWAKNYIAQLAIKKILGGFPDGVYRPNAPVTRAELASILDKAFERNKVRNVIAFKDVATNYWAYAPIRQAYEMGFLDANANGVFNPDQKVSRLDVLIALAKGLNYSVNNSTDAILRVYRDASAIPRSDRDLVAAVTEREMVVSYPNVAYLYPERTVTRAEVAALIYRALVSTGQAENIVSPYVVVVADPGSNSGVREEPRRQETSPRRRPTTDNNQRRSSSVQGQGSSNNSTRQTPSVRRRTNTSQ